jgi:hypothetical protein
MSTSKPTTSKVKIAAYAFVQALDKAAIKVAAREKIPLIRAYPRALKEMR